MHERAGEAGQLREEVAHLQQSHQEKNKEKDTVIGLFRRGRIDESDLDRQLDQIQQEESNIQKQIEQVQVLVQNARSIDTSLRTAEEMLQTLRQRLEEPITWEIKRQVVEALVERILVRTVFGEGGKSKARITVNYRFGVSFEL